MRKKIECKTEFYVECITKSGECQIKETFLFHKYINKIILKVHATAHWNKIY